MPYEKTTELPKGVKENLPKHAEKIYKSAYNNAWEQYKNPEDREGSREETAHRVAWAAVKKKYEKRDGKWVKKKD
jgi:cation transport regulator